MGANAGGIRAGRAFIEIFGDKSKLVAVLRSVQTDLGRFSGWVRNLGRNLFAGGMGLATGMAAITRSFGESGQELMRVSQVTGITVANLSALQYAATKTGASADSVGNSLQAMQSKLVAAAMGSGEAVQSFAYLGINAAHLAQLRPEDQFKLIADRLSKIRNPALQASMAMDIFGGSAEELLPLLRQGANGIRTLEDEARALGVVWSGDDAKAATKFSQALSSLWSVLKMVKDQVGAALAPVLTEFIGYLTQGLVKVAAWVRENRGLVVSFAKIVGVVIAVGAGLIALSFATSAIATGFGMIARASILTGAVLQRVWNAAAVVIRVLRMPLGLILTAFKNLAMVVIGVVKAAFTGGVAAIAGMITPIGVLGIALVALGGYFLYASGVIQMAIEDIQTLFQDMKADVSEALGGIVDALMAGDIALAARILWLLLKLEWERGVGFLNKIWQTFKAFFLSTWNEANSNLAGFFLNAVSAIATGWTETVNFLADVWTLFTVGLRKAWFETIGFVQKAWTRLKGLFDSDLDVEAEVKRINEETEGKNNALVEERDKTIGDRDAARRKKLADIEAERKAMLQANEDMRKAENERIAGNAANSIAETEQQIAAAKDEMGKSIKDAAVARERAKRKATAPDDPGGGGIGAFGALSTVGTFSGFGLRGIGNAGPLDAIKVATQQTAENTDPANIKTEKMHLK